MTRFPAHADGPDDATRYLRERARQGVIDGWKASPEVEPLRDDGCEWGLRAFSWSPAGERHQTVYVYASHRQRGRFTEHLARTRDTPVAIPPDRDLERDLERLGARYSVITRFIEIHEYQQIAGHYGDLRAARSDLYYMNHIDEGLAVLHALGASERARRAFCLHPILQADDALRAAYAAVPRLTPDPQVLTLAMEYRHVANSTLSHRALAGPEDIALSPLDEVNDMLRADKLQNYKDFLAHHAATHPRRAALDRYFRLWLARLGIDDASRAHLFAAMEPFVR